MYGLFCRPVEVGWPLVYSLSRREGDRESDTCKFNTLHTWVCWAPFIGKQQNLFSAIWLDVHNDNIRSVGYFLWAMLFTLFIIMSTYLIDICFKWKEAQFNWSITLSKYCASDEILEVEIALQCGADRQTPGFVMLFWAGWDVPAWAVAICSISQSAEGTSQLDIFKT